MCQMEKWRKKENAKNNESRNGLKGTRRLPLAHSHPTQCGVGLPFYYWPRYAFRAAWTSCWVCFLSIGWKLPLRVRLADCVFYGGVSSIMPAWPSLRTHLTAQGAQIYLKNNQKRRVGMMLDMT